MDREINKVYCAESQMICSLGSSKQEVITAINSYQTSLSRFDDGTPICKIDRSKLKLNKVKEYTFAEQLAICTLSDVVEKSAVSITDPRTALIISTTKGNIEMIDKERDRSFLSALAHKITSHFGREEKVTIISNACVSGVTAIAVGSRMIISGQVDHAFIVGVDVISEFIVSGFNSFKSISSTICTPYDRDRDGLTLGEGCGALLLTANKELSESKLIISGYGLSDDANHISGPSRTGDGLYLAIDKAMKMANVSSEEVALVNTHGTATPFNDDMESKALNLAGLLLTPCNSIKPYIGHTLGASGVIEVIVAMAQMSANRVFGVKGYKSSGVPYELNVSAEHRDIEIPHCVKCASGFGGTNAAIVISKEADYKADIQKTEVKNIVECGSITLSNSESEVTSSVKLKEIYKELGEVNMKFYKMNNLAKAGYVASCKMLKELNIHFPDDRISVILANRSGSLDADILHQANVDKRLPEGTSPAIFVYTLANIVAAEIAIKHKFKGESTTFIMEEKDMEYLKEYSLKLIHNQECDAVLYGWCELLGDNYEVELKMIKKE